MFVRSATLLGTPSTRLSETPWSVGHDALRRRRGPKADHHLAKGMPQIEWTFFWISFVVNIVIWLCIDISKYAINFHDSDKHFTEIAIQATVTYVMLASLAFELCHIDQQQISCFSMHLYV